MVSLMRKSLDKKKAEKSLLTKQVKEERQKRKELETKYNDELEARSLIQQVAKETQENVKVHFSEIVSSALKEIFPKPINLILDFVPKRNKTECEVWFEENEKMLDPQFSEGGSALDVASFAVRLAYVSMGKSRPVIVMDEPFKDLDKNARTKIPELLPKLSEELKIQIIMVTHEPIFEKGADKIFRIENGKVKDDNQKWEE